MMHVGNDVPASLDESRGNVSANALACARDDRGPFGAHRQTPALSVGAKQSNDSPMPETRAPIDLKGLSLAELQKLLDERRLPPVDKWEPERCGHSRMRIARDGTWYHEGSPISRPAMVRLFSTVLRREADGRHVLVTPVEKLDIDVEGTAFRALEMSSEGEGRERRIAFRLDSGDAVILGADHPLRLDETPRILVRHGLEAELSRPVYYELAEIAIAESADPPGVWSDGTFFRLDSR
jgi:hypothetical protein